MKQADCGFDDGSLTTPGNSIRGTLHPVRVTAIVKHPLTFHTRQKPVNCNMCGKCFSRHTSLVAHITIHNGAKPSCIKHAVKFHLA
jgi:uncharacterized Zn-finger protein